MADEEFSLNDLSNLDLDALADNAKKKFKLTDKLRGIKSLTAREPVFLDMEAARAYRRLQSKLDNMEKPLERARQSNASKDAGKVTNKQLAEMEAGVEEFKAQVEAAKIEMLKSTLSVHFRAIPDIAIDVAKRKARKQFRDEQTKQIPQDDETIEAYNLFLDKLLMADSIEKIVDAEGAEDDQVDFAAVEQLIQLVGPAQAMRLRESFKMLTFADGVGQNATDDPGF